MASINVLVTLGGDVGEMVLCHIEKKKEKDRYVLCSLCDLYFGVSYQKHWDAYQNVPVHLLSIGQPKSASHIKLRKSCPVT